MLGLGFGQLISHTLFAAVETAASVAAETAVLRAWSFEASGTGCAEKVLLGWHRHWIVPGGAVVV